MRSRNLRRKKAQSLDFDLCQKCLLGLNAFMIAIYNYSKSDIYMSQQFDNVDYYEQNLHVHPIVRILREPTYTEVPLKCPEELDGNASCLTQVP